LIAQGAKAVADVSDACRGDAVVTMLANDSAVEEIVLGAGGVIDSLPAGALHVSSSTISVALSEKITSAHAKAGQRFVRMAQAGKTKVSSLPRLPGRWSASFGQSLDTCIP
jgi:3-hydroxyisobutyrate dehydrogenase-like beta-hydroxyacid dehydrogenase